MDWLAKNNKTKPLGFQPYQEPIKSLGVKLSYNQDRNNNLNFFVKIHKMDTKLNMWQTRDLTLYGWTMLVKSLGIYIQDSLCGLHAQCS